jgi:hypothetical protein
MTWAGFILNNFFDAGTEKIRQRIHHYDDSPSFGIQKSRGPPDKIFENRFAGFGREIGKNQIPGAISCEKRLGMGGKFFLGDAVLPGVVFGNLPGEFIPILTAYRAVCAGGGADSENSHAAPRIEDPFGRGPGIKHLGKNFKQEPGPGVNICGTE